MADERTTAVARALCAVDGKDPDEKMKRPGEGAGFRAVQGAADTPSMWEAYVGEAERYVAAIEAMQPFLDRARRW